MESQTLKIQNVDFALLDSQRLTLATIPRDGMSFEQIEAINGIESMLDFWSDKRYHEKRESAKGEACIRT